MGAVCQHCKQELPLGLTFRERQVLELLAQGWSNAGIAQQLVIGRKSVENYTNRIYAALGIGGEPSKDRRVMAALRYLAWRAERGVEHT